MQKWYPKELFPKGTPKVSQNHKNWFQQPSQNRVPTKHRKMTILSTPECGQSVVNRSKINEFQVLVLTPFGVSFWRCFGSPNGDQNHQKVTSKKHQQFMPKMNPNWSQRGPKLEPKSSKVRSWKHLVSRLAPKWPPDPLQDRFWRVWGPFCDHFRQFF